MTPEKLSRLKRYAMTYLAIFLVCLLIMLLVVGCSEVDRYSGYGQCYDTRVSAEYPASFNEPSGGTARTWKVRDLNGMEYYVTPEISGYFLCRVTQDTPHNQELMKKYRDPDALP